MKSKKSATMYYGLIMATYSIGYVAMSAFSSVYLLDASSKRFLLLVGIIVSRSCCLYDNLINLRLRMRNHIP